MSEKTIKNIGWIGTGVMGKSMCDFLVKKGYNVAVYNRTQSKIKDLIDQGASTLELTKESFQKHDLDVLIVMVGAPKDVRQVLLNTPDKDSNLLSFMKPGSIVIDHTSSSADLAIELSNYCKDRNVSSIDAPVTGGDVGAKNGTLAILAGCDDEQAIERVSELIGCYSKKLTNFGKAGLGHQAKMANQICLAQTMLGVVESLMYGYSVGLDLELM